MMPKILGILNITEDSFSDGGKYLDKTLAIAKAHELIHEGADFIDIGLASSHPSAKKVDAETEIKRLSTVIGDLIDLNIPISIDSPKTTTQSFALKHKVSILNDITGFPNKDIYPELAKSDCSLIVMHSIYMNEKAIIKKTIPELVVKGLYQFFEKRIQELQNAGIENNRLILDPGMGFFLGSNPETSIAVINEIPKLKTTFGLPVLISTSRKSFLRNITSSQIKDSEPETLSSEIFCTLKGVDYIRTHNVKQLRKGLQVLEQLSKDSF